MSSSDVLLSVLEVAELKGCTERYVRKLCSDGKLVCKTLEVTGRGSAGLEYRIPLKSLDSKLQLKYKRLTFSVQEEVLTINTPTESSKSQKLNLQADSVRSALKPAEKVNLETLTQTERNQVAFWTEMLSQWNTFRVVSSLSKAEADAQFVAFTNVNLASESTFDGLPTEINVKMLYRKAKALKDKGEAGLVDKRGKHGSHNRKLTSEMLDIFEFYYLHKSKKTISLCMFLTSQELKRIHGFDVELPTRGTFERAVKAFPIPHVLYFRESEKAYIGKCAPYIRRMYDDLAPNDIWVADGHTFDVMVLSNDNKPIRVYLSAFMDVRTRKMMGWIVTEKLSGDATIYALKQGVEKYGVPKQILVDNGREYLFTDFSGEAGFRKKAKTVAGEFKPPTILSNLGIDIKVAIPKNARAKGIERAFDTVKETFSKLFDSYTGGTILEKPDDLKETLGQPDKLVKIGDFINFVDTYITGFYNKQPHSGEGMNGLSPDEVFSNLLVEKRVVPKDKLNLMFMRYGKGALKVSKNGVTLKVYGQKLQYSDPTLWRDYFGREVYVRYSPDDLSQVRVYDTDNKFICIATLETTLSYNATKEEIAEQTSKKKAQEKIVKEYKKVKDTQAQDALTAVINKATENLEEPERFDAKILKIVQSEANEEATSQLPKASGESLVMSIIGKR